MSEKLTAVAALESDEQYDRFEQAVRERVAGLAGPFFQTDASPDALWDAYLSNLPEQRRQHYNCSACRRFVRRFGPLVTIDKDGKATPAVWSLSVPAFFAGSVEGLRRVVAKSDVSGVFLSSEPNWGVPRTKAWTHLSGPSPWVYAGAVKSAAQEMAEKKDDFAMLCRGLADYPKAVVNQALTVLRADAMDRSEKTFGVAQWLSALHAKVLAFPARRDNLIWAAVAAAPPGFCHVRSTVIATLLDDIVAGLPFESIRQRWAQKMHPLRYQRPQAAPKAGTIEQAEKLVEKLGVAASLGRRFARLEDVLAKLWVPRAEGPQRSSGGGVFAHLRPAARGSAKLVELPAGAITWEKFGRSVLPEARQIEVQVPARGSFYGLVTAADPAAPPILQWDGLAGHPPNPVSWYFYSEGSSASQWGLSPGWAKVSAVFYGPPHWQEPEKFAHHARHVFFAIKGARDGQTSTLALFPEFLKPDFHGIRAVIEAHSRSARLAGGEEADANGLAFNKGSPVTVRVRAADSVATYTIDRFD